jgi:hypothetical protein
VSEPAAAHQRHLAHSGFIRYLGVMFRMRASPCEGIPRYAQASASQAPGYAIAHAIPGIRD